MATIILGFCMIALGSYNIIIWKIIEKYGVSKKAELIGRFFVRNRYNFISKRMGVIIKYNVNNRDYISKIVVNKNSDLYEGVISNEYNVILLENHPKIVVGNIERHPWKISIWLFMLGFIIISTQIF